MRAQSDSLRLDRKMRPHAAFALLAEADLAAIAGHLETLARRNEVEDVHVLRVAIRHLRAVAWTFGPALPKGMARRWRGQLGELADAASAVRDWDVFALETLKPALDSQPDDPVLLAVLHTAAARRADAHSAMLERLAQCHHWPLPALQRELVHLQGGVGPHVPENPSLGRFARVRVAQARKRLRALARAARGGGMAQLHKLRIGGKLLRYTVEALADVLPASKAEPLRAKLVKRQTRLGRIIDDAVARRLLCECLAETPGAQAADATTAAPPDAGARSARRQRA